MLNIRDDDPAFSNSVAGKAIPLAEVLIDSMISTSKSTLLAPVADRRLRRRAQCPRESVAHTGKARTDASSESIA
jgi:hypothetical protein